MRLLFREKESLSVDTKASREEFQKGTRRDLATKKALKLKLRDSGGEFPSTVPTKCNRHPVSLVYPMPWLLFLDDVQ